jgi:hypothetical protein
MLTILRILLKIFVREFYAINAGYFLFFFILFFGVVSPGNLIFYHEALIMGMLDSVAFLTGVLLLWFSYNLKCIFFCAKVLNKPGSLFLANLYALPATAQLAVFLIVQLLLYLPVLIYSFFVIAICFRENHVSTGVSIIIFQLLNIVLATIACYHNQAGTRQSMVARIKMPALFNKRSFLLYLINYTAIHRKISFVTIKIFSLFLLFIIFTLNKNDFEHINFVVLFLILIAAHAVLPFYYISFIEKKCSWYRNLPLSLFRILSAYFISYCIVLVPELVYLLINAIDYMHVAQIILLYAIAVANLLLYTAILYTADMRMKKYLQIVFIIFFVSIFLLNLQYYLVMAAAELLLAAFIMTRVYHLYESKEAVS